MENNKMNLRWSLDASLNEDGRQTRKNDSPEV
jgi:hypothetical protein